MAKIICLFNHKGGVSKTTTAFNLGWKMAEMGSKVLLADFDPQCNLTGMVMGFDGIDDLEAIYTSNPANNVRDALSPAFEAKPKQIEAAQCLSVKGNANLYLLAGHIALSEYETTLGVAQELSGSLLPLRNLPGSIRYMLDETANNIDADYVIVDMSPSLGPMNQNLFTTCDYFIVPLHPDYFSAMALSSLARTLPRWKSWAVTAHSVDVLNSADYPFPRPNAQFIGSIVQKYRPRLGKASKAFQHWIDQLEEGMRSKLVPALQGSGMLDPAMFQTKVGFAPSTAIMEVADFNSLIALSQDVQVPVYALTESQTGHEGAVWQQTKASMAVFEQAFKLCADRVLALTQSEQ